MSVIGDMLRMLYSGTCVAIIDTLGPTKVS